jgi:NADH:ubiquinone oxidoreductase subunit 6 (subunit J)
MLLLLNILLSFNCLCGVLLIISKDSIYALISLVLTILGSCLSLFFFGFEFLALLILLAYIGAITILFLFLIVMLELGQSYSSKVPNKQNKSISGSICTYSCYQATVFSYYFNAKVSNTINNFSLEYLKTTTDFELAYPFIHIKDTDIFASLFTQKYYFIILVGLILLFGMVGSITLCVKTKTKT